MGVYSGPEVVEDGLVLALDAGNLKSYPGSGSTWTDLSGQGNNGTLNTLAPALPSYNSDNGGSLSFDGKSQNIIFPNNSFGKPNNITMEIWVKHTDSSQSISYVGGIDGGPGGYMGFSIRKDSGNWRFYIGGGGKTQNDVIGDVYQANTIVHLVGTYDGTAMKFYTNGVLKTTSTNYSGNIVYYSAPTAHIAGKTILDPESLNGSESLKGNLYSYKLYNRALTASEIQQNYTATKSRFGL